MGKWRAFLFLLLAFFLTPFYLGVVHAGSVSFNPSSTSLSVGGTAKLDLVVNAGTDQTNSTQVYVVYDPQYLEPVTVISGSFYPQTTYMFKTGKVYVIGYITATYKTGTGSLASFTIRGVKTGTTTLTYDCRASTADTTFMTKYNDTSGVNLITCSQNGTASITVTQGSGTLTPTPSSLTPAPTSIVSTVVPTSAPSSTITAPSPTALMQTGAEDVALGITTMGIAFVIFGGVVRLLLLS